MANIEVKHLVNTNRFPVSNDKSVLLTILYAPIGLLFLILRSILMLLFFVLGQILPSTPPAQAFLNNLACLCFGITVSVENQRKKENVEVFVSNSLSIFDHVAVSKAVGPILPLCKTPLSNLPCFGIEDVGSVNNADVFRKNLEKVTKDGKTPILVCPEESSTNGKALLKFNSQYFKFFQKVQPLCITIKRPLFNIAISTLGSTYMNDILYFMFSPFTNYNIKFLPSMERKSLSEDEFADIIRQNIAADLKIEATDITSSDLSEWSKRKILEERRRNQERLNTRSANRRLSPELSRMATQVKEVLPHVPVTAIYNDLVITRNVDITISNILEGRVRFIPESNSSSLSAPSTSTQASSSSPSKGALSSSGTLPPSQLSIGALTFGKNTTERTRSFQERKDQLIAAARRRYIEKHNLDIPL